MDRRQFLQQSALAAGAAFIPFKRNDLSEAIAGSFTELRRNVGYYTNKGGTIGWLAAEDGFAVVDAQFPKTARSCLKGLQQRTNHGLDLLINTHHHRDHTAGNPVFQPVAQKMVAQQNVPILMKQVSGHDKDPVEPAYPSITFKRNWKMKVGRETIHAHYFGPAHTGGDAVIYFENANVVHVGDLVFNRMNPYTDRPHGGSIHHWVKVLDKVQQKYPDDAMFIFGHGKPEAGVMGQKKDLRMMQNYFSAMVEYVQQGIDKGKSKKEILSKKKMEKFPNFLYADFWTLSQNLEVVYKEIKGKKWLPVKKS